MEGDEKSNSPRKKAGSLLLWKDVERDYLERFKDRTPTTQLKFVMAVDFTSNHEKIAAKTDKIRLHHTGDGGLGEVRVKNKNPAKRPGLLPAFDTGGLTNVDDSQFSTVKEKDGNSIVVELQQDDKANSKKAFTDTMHDFYDRHNMSKSTGYNEALRFQQEADEHRFESLWNVMTEHGSNATLRLMARRSPESRVNVAYFSDMTTKGLNDTAKPAKPGDFLSLSYKHGYANGNLNKHNAFWEYGGEYRTAEEETAAGSSTTVTLSPPLPPHTHTTPLPTTPRSQLGVLSDPRFRAGRRLVESGKADLAVPVFATLTEESRAKYGDESLETAACFYEYGNALFRSAGRREGEDHGGKKKEEEVAQSPTKRTRPSQGDSPHDHDKVVDATVKREEASDVEHDDEEDDVTLALEMMKNSYSIVENALAKGGTDTTSASSTYCRTQIPRILCGMGDLHSFQSNHADSADAYLRAVPHREDTLLAYADSSAGDKHLTLPHLKARRLVVEAHVLVAEELLAWCPSKEEGESNSSSSAAAKEETSSGSSKKKRKRSDTETATVATTVKPSERVDFARGYYEKAREELQETVYLMGKIASSGVELGSEKEDLCFLATILMGVGNKLADSDEHAAGDAAVSKNK